MKRNEEECNGMGQVGMGRVIGMASFLESVRVLHVLVLVPGTNQEYICWYICDIEVTSEESNGESSN